MVVNHFDMCACVSYWRSGEYHELPRVSPKGAWNCKPWAFGRSDHSDVWFIIIASCIPSSRQAAAAAIASKEETEGQVQTLQQDCGWARLSQGWDLLYPEMKGTWEDKPRWTNDKPPRFQKVLANWYRSILRMTIVFYPKLGWIGWFSKAI